MTAGGRWPVDWVQEAEAMESIVLGTTGPALAALTATLLMGGIVAVWIRLGKG